MAAGMIEQSRAFYEERLAPDLLLWGGITYDSRKVYTQDPLVACFEKIGSLLAAELLREGLTDSADSFLEVHAANVGRGI